MRRWILVAALVLVPASSWAVFVKCPSGTTWAGNDIRDCPCCDWCLDGSWVVEGDECPEPARKIPPHGPAHDLPSAPTEPPETTAFDSLMSAIAGIGGGAMGLGLIVFVLGAYLVPWVIAARRQHHQADAILVLNVLLGWTVLGWIAALIWATTAVKHEG